MKTNNQPAPAAKTLQASGRFDTENAIGVLTDFMREVRKELRKNKKVTVSANCDSAMNHLHFIADGFELTFILTEK